jgi:hypothetical protein
MKFDEEKRQWCEIERFEVNTLIMILGKMDVEFFKCAKKNRFVSEKKFDLAKVQL